MRKRKQPPLAEIEPRRICIIKPSALGDVVQALPALVLLRRRFPAAHIAWVVKQHFVDLLRGHADLDEVIPLASPRGRIAQAHSFVSLLRRLRGGKFDLVIDLQGLFRSGLMCWASRAPRRLGIKSAREGATLAYTDLVDVPWKRQSAVANNCQVVAALGCLGEPPVASLPMRQEDRDWAQRELAKLPRPIMAIHPGAQWETKRWPPAHFAELARRAHGELGAGVVLVGGPGDGKFCQQIEKVLRSQSVRLVNVAEQTTLMQLAAMAEVCDVFLSGDSGPMHVAAAVGTLVVAVFTCTSPLRAGPRGGGHCVVQTDVSCRESYLKTCRSLACMGELTPDRVWPGLRTMLRSAAGKSVA